MREQSACHLLSPLSSVSILLARLPLAPSWFGWGRLDEVRGRKGWVCLMLFSGAGGAPLGAWQVFKETPGMVWVLK